MELGEVIKDLERKISDMPECGSREEYKQLKEWLEELQMYREKSGRIKNEKV